MSKFEVNKFLDQNVKLATGCTEPVVVAYATSIAYFALHDVYTKKGKLKKNIKVPKPKIKKIKSISVKIDRNVYKNAMAVYIPGTEGKKGLKSAAALGIFLSPRDKLNLFSKINQQIIEVAEKIEEKVNIEKIMDTKQKAELDVNVKLEYLYKEKLKKSEIRLRYAHDYVVLIKVNEKIIYKNLKKIRNKENTENLPESLFSWLKIVENISKPEIEKLYKGVEINLKIAKKGLKNKYGLAVGRSLKALQEKKVLQKDLINKVKIYAASAGDARMGGAKEPVMSTAGSGNQGITAIIPIAVVAKQKKISKEKTAKAVLLSHIITRFAKEQAGHLSALCGCAVKAGMGAAGGLTYLLDGKTEDINNAINIMAANITGMICDGAKVGCSLKLACAAGQAVESAFLALQGVDVPDDNGIVYKNSIDTIKNIGRTSNAMVETDIEIIKIMQRM